MKRSEIMRARPNRTIIHLLAQGANSIGTSPSILAYRLPDETSSKDSPGLSSIVALSERSLGQVGTGRQLHSSPIA
jgi:hypothetical protein